MECPTCKATLHNSAKYCGCGWKRDNHFSNPDPIIDCAHMGCSIPAKVKIKTKTGYANLCLAHYDKHFADEAQANLDKYGLALMADETRAEHVLRMRQFVKTGFKSIGKSMYATPRQSEDAKKAAISQLMDDWATDVGTQA